MIWIALSKEGEKDDGDGVEERAAEHEGVWSLGSIQWKEIMES